MAEAVKPTKTKTRKKQKVKKTALENLPDVPLEEPEGSGTNVSEVDSTVLKSEKQLEEKQDKTKIADSEIQDNDSSASVGQEDKLKTDLGETKTNEPIDTVLGDTETNVIEETPVTDTGQDLSENVDELGATDETVSVSSVTGTENQTDPSSVPSDGAVNNENDPEGVLPKEEVTENKPLLQDTQFDEKIIPEESTVKSRLKLDTKVKSASPQTKSKVVHRKLYPQLESLMVDIKYKPLTDQQLKTLYYNPELEHLQEKVDTFLQEVQRKPHPFYELLTNYQRARINFVNCEKEINSLRADAARYSELMWQIVERTAHAEAQCVDRVKLVQDHKYQQVKFDQEMCNNLARTLGTIRTNLHDDLSLHAYSSQLSRLQVESYIHNQYMRSPALKDVPRNAPVQTFRPEDRDSDCHKQVMEFRTCISILFEFQRRIIKDDQFRKDTCEWLQRLVSSLLRVATFDDHLFILNHVMRCPAGVGQWGASFIQLSRPVLIPGQGSFGSPLLDHFVVMLATLLVPVKARDEFLQHLKVVMTPGAEKANDNPWILVDSDGEEDEDPSNYYYYFQENDLVALLDQFPMDVMFEHILQIHRENDQPIYNIHITTEHSILKLFAFATCIIRLLGQGLQTFSLSRYRQFNKRLGRQIRHTLQFVSDHWQNFKLTLTYVAENTIQRLQLEYDHIFMRATDAILSAQRLGSWQYMADMPYACVSMEMMWKLLWLLHYGDMEKTTNFSENSCEESLKDPDSKLVFEEKLLCMPTSEAIYLLTAFANMARSRPAEEIDFVNTVASEMFEIAYVSSHTREFCSKVGRQLLASIAMVHPSIMATLLTQIREHMDKIGMVAVYLFRELPLFLWKPSDSDLQILREWLLDADLTSPESQLTRLIISKMNWGLNKQEDDLELDLSIHQYIAALLVEAHCKHVSDKHMTGLIAEGVKQVASAVRNQSTPQQQFSQWTWSAMMKLRLHRNNRPKPVLGSSYVNGKIPSLSDPELHIIAKKVKENDPLASYVALNMTKIGNDSTDFLETGLDLLQCLLSHQHYKAATQGIAVAVPLFYSCQHYLIKNEKFLNILQTLLAADQTYAKMAKSLLSAEFPGQITKLFVCMIQMQLTNASVPGSGGVLCAIEMWMKILMTISKWYMDRNIQCVMDSLIKSAVRCKGGQELVEGLIYDQYKILIKTGPDQSVLSSIVSWIATGNTLPSFITQPSLGEFPWLAYQLLHAEEQYEQDTQLWNTIHLELMANRKMGVDQATKRAAHNLKLEVVPAASRLCIYRWAQLALDADLDHPLLPVIWQRFFALFLGRVTTEPGLPNRGGMGEKFFETTSDITLMKKMKKKLYAAADHHHKVATERKRSHSWTADPPGATATPEDGDDDDDEEEEVLLHNVGYLSSRDFHQRLVRLYKTFSFWLDEPRLHDASLYLPALPAEYDSEKLLRLFQNNKDPWLEFVDSDRVDYELDQLLSEWVSETCTRVNFRMRRNSMQELYQPGAAVERILERLKRYDTPLPPPPLVPVKAPVPDINPQILGDRDSLMYTITQDFGSLTDFSKLFAVRVSKHMAFDLHYIEMVPGMYRNEPTEVELVLGCKSKFNPTHQCRGPAVVALRIDVKKRRDLVCSRVDANRSECNQLILESMLPTPQNVCSSVVHVENAITSLINLSKSTSDLHVRHNLHENGAFLFYHLAGLVTDETKLYPPTRQFFSSCIEVLGQEFIRNNPSQSQPVLEAIIQLPALAGLLSPNFSPNSCPHSFVSMYREVIEVPHKQGCDLGFMLLTKFDIGQWLSNTKPPLTERSNLVKLVGQALSMCGQQPGDMQMVFEIYRTNLKTLLSFQFPDHYADVLKFLLASSSADTVSPLVWHDFLNCLGCSYDRREGFNQKNLALLTKTQALLSVTQMQESLQWLAKYFLQLRITTPDFATFGLYPKWKVYVNPLSVFIGFLCGSTIVKTASQLGAVNSGMNPEQELESIWTLICDVFSPWIQPLDSNGGTLNPWIASDTTAASDMVAMFAETVECLHKHFEGLTSHGSKNALGLLWTYYASMLAKPGPSDHVLQVFHARLVTLPWDKFYPSIQAVDLMVQIQNQSPKTCVSFLGCVFSQISWQVLIDSYHKHGLPADTAHVHASVLQLLVQLTKEPTLMDENASTFPKVLESARSFYWQYLDATSYHFVTEWVIHNCNPKYVLAERSTPQGRLLMLLKAAAGFVSSDTPLHPDTPQKRVHLVHCLIQLICRCSFEKDLDEKILGPVVVNLMTEVEMVVGTVLHPTEQWNEGLALVTEVVGLLNNCNPETRTVGVILKSLVQWIESSPCSVLLMPTITAACRSIASVEHMAQVVETCMDAHFNSGLDLSESGGWGKVLATVQVPELTLQEFLGECVRQGCYLTLFAYTLQQLPLCQNLDEERSHLANLIEWTNNVKPVPENEAKLFLWWFKIMELVLRQADFGADMSVVIRMLSNLTPALTMLGEDKASTGILGAIGLGRKSILSLRFRVIARSLAVFLSAQIVNQKTIRTQGQPSSSGQPAISSQALHAIADLEKLKTNKQYLAFRDQLEYAVQFVRNTDNTVRRGQIFLANMTKWLFPEKRYLAILHV